MSNKNISSAALTKEQLFQEWKEVRSEGLSYARAGKRLSWIERIIMVITAQVIVDG